MAAMADKRVYEVRSKNVGRTAGRQRFRPSDERAHTFLSIWLYRNKILFLIRQNDLPLSDIVACYTSAIKRKLQMR